MIEEGEGMEEKQSESIRGEKVRIVKKKGRKCEWGLREGYKLEREKKN